MSVYHWVNNEIYLRRYTKIAVPTTEHFSQELLPSSYLLQLNGNLSKMGYVVAPELAYQLEQLSHEQFSRLAEQTITHVQKMVDDWVSYRPMYPNFPSQVKALSQEELRFNAAMHYLGDWFGVRILPMLRKDPRPPLDSVNQTFTLIAAGDESEFFAIFERLLASRVSWSEQDRDDIEWFASQLSHIPVLSLTKLALNDWLLMLQKDERYLSNKENQATWVALLLAYQHIPAHQALMFSQTATDILRVAVAWSKGDVSLATPSRFVSIPRTIRKALLTRLEAIADERGIVEDMKRYAERYKRLGERLHPSEFSEKYPKVNEAFTVIRGNIAINSFNRHVETLLQVALTPENLQQTCTQLITILATRPGEFARRLDKLLRLYPSQQSEIVTAFAQVMDDVATTILLQMHAHFAQRSGKQLPLYRVFFPKGQTSKLFAKGQNLPELPQTVCEQVNACIEASLIRRFAQKTKIGKAYIDPLLKNMPVPLVQRTASKALHTLPQGSFLSLPNAETLRLFVYWQEGDDRADIDLSAVFLADDFSHIDTVSYYNLKNFGGYHSGDITSAPDGASEFIDLDLTQLKNTQIRYVMMLLNSYTTQPYCDLPICFAGLMGRNSPNSGEIYEPSTVKQRFDVSSNSVIAIPLIIDLHNYQWQWTDLTLTRYPNTFNNVIGNLSNISLMGYAMQILNKVSLYQLLHWHTLARGEAVAQPEQADVVFLADNSQVDHYLAQGKQVVTAMDIDKLTAEFL